MFMFTKPSNIATSNWIVTEQIIDYINFKLNFSKFKVFYKYLCMFITRALTLA